MRQVTAQDPRYVLLSVQPIFANKIFDGSKTVELRRRFPKVYESRTVIIYVSTPVKAIAGGFQISRVVTASPSELWHQVKDDAGVTQQQFDDYYAGSGSGHAIFISNAWKVKKPVSLELLRNRLNFSAPQNFRYLQKTHLDQLEASGLLYPDHSDRIG